MFTEWLHIRLPQPITWCGQISGVFLAFPALLWRKRHWRDKLSIINSGINVDLDTNIVLLQMISKNALTDQTTDLYIVTCSTPNTLAQNQTRPDTRQSSRLWLCRSSNVKTTRNSKMWPPDQLKDQRTDTASCRVAYPRLKSLQQNSSGLAFLSKLPTPELAYPQLSIS